MNQLVAAQADPQTARAYWTMGRGDTERAFRAARSHSQRVRILRVAVPATVVVLIATFALWTWLNPMRLLARKLDNFGDVIVSGTKITMESPRITGVTRDGRNYELVAKAAAQDLTRPDWVELRDLNGRFVLPDGTETVVTAPTGNYNSKQEQLNLGKGSIVTFSNGYKVWLDDAAVDMRNSNMKTDKPVEIEMLQGKLNAKRLEITESGDLMRFDGGVRMTLDFNNEPAAK